MDADSDSDISRVSLPPSLFQSHPSLSDQRGLVFTSYSTAVLFPLTQSESTNSTRLSMIGSSVLAATVVSGQSNAVRNLTEPVVAEFRVNRSMVGINGIRQKRIILLLSCMLASSYKVL